MALLTSPCLGYWAESLGDERTERTVFPEATLNWGRAAMKLARWRANERCSFV